MPEILGSINEVGFVDIIHLNLRAGRQYIIDVDGDPNSLNPLLDPWLSVLHANGEFVFSVSPNPSDNDGPGLQPQLFFTPTTSEEFTFVVSESGENDTGAFRLKVFVDDFRNAPEGAAPAGEPGAGATGRINYAGDVDIFQAVLLAGLSYKIDLRGTDSRAGNLDDPKLQLYHFSGAFLGEDDNGGNGFDASLQELPTESAFYVIAASGVEDTTGTYRVSVSEDLGTAEGDVVEGFRFFGYDDRVNTLAGEDRVSGGEGDDVLKGGDDADRLQGDAGLDTLLGGDGKDRLRGGDDPDTLVGGRGRDLVAGGGGPDRFDFNDLRESGDTLRAGDGAPAFQGAGHRRGDLIDLRGLDANTERDGNQAFKFGTAQGIGRVWVENDGDDTRVLANVDGDARAEFRIVIADAQVTARDYSVADFLL